MKKAVLGFILFILVAVVYFFWPDFNVIKKLIGYNVPGMTDQPVSKPNINNDDNGLGFLNVPDGFKISIAADNLENPRVMIFDPKGRMLVSETKAGRVRILEDKDGNGDFEATNILVENLKSPHGLDFYTDQKKTIYLYIAETQQVARYPYDVNTGKLTQTIGENIATLPADGQHITRTIVFGPNMRDTSLIKGKQLKSFFSETKLYISVGSSCDVCLEDAWKRASILESDPDGTFTAEFAGGLRNAVFFTFHPDTKEIWATEMGRDNLGDDLPPDEINIVKVAGPEHKFGARRFGWPFCYGNKIKDETFKPKKIERIDIPTDCSQTDAPVIEISAHSAPLGLAFIPRTHSTSSGQGWPSQWENDLLVAYHGSWNRSEPTGYKIIRFRVDKTGKVSEAVDFITGWLSSSKRRVYGRPVDLKFGPNGALYISDDATGIIYKLSPES